MIALKAFLFGLTLAVAVGPIALLILGYGTRHGLRAGGPAALGAALADLTYALMAFFLGNRLAPHLEAHTAGLRLTASLVLLGLGVAGLGRLLTDRRWIARLNLASGLAIALFGLSGLRAALASAG